MIKKISGKIFIVCLSIMLLPSVIITLVKFSLMDNVSYSSSSTLVAGIISENTTWTLDNSPYIVVGDVLVDEGVYLTIEPGVVVKFANNTRLVVDGFLIARGNFTHMITFTSNSSPPMPGDWQGIKFRGSKNTTLDFVIVEYGGASMDNWAIQDDAGSLTIRNSIVRFNKYAIRASGSSLMLQSCTVENNVQGIFGGNLSIHDCTISKNGFGVDCDVIYMKNCVIKNNLEWGVSYFSGIIEDSFIHNNTRGLSGGDVVIKNCTITENQVFGFYSSGGSGTAVKIYNSTFSNNGVGVSLGAWSTVNSLEIYNSTITYNQLAGVKVTPSGKSLHLMACKISNNYYGIHSKGSLEIFQSIISDNNGTGVHHTGALKIMYSKIIDNKGNGAWIDYSQENEERIITFCHLYSNTPYEVVSNIPYTYNINATCNWWGTTDETLIGQKIYDFYDNYDVGKVIYKPFLTPPSAYFTYSPDTPYAYGTINFDASASFNPHGSIVNYEWDFGDGNFTATTSPIISHTYISPGNYNVTLEIIDEFGLTNSSSTVLSVYKDDIPPVTVDDYDDMWRNIDFTITLIAIDHETDVAETYYRINNGPISRVGVDGQPLITTESSNNSLEYWSVDNAGNEEEHKFLTGIKLDKTVPSIVEIRRQPEGDVEPSQAVKILVNATDSLSGVKDVILSYSISDSSSWIDVLMTFNATSGFYEGIIQGQQADTIVKYKISIYDNAGNSIVEDNNGQYYAYTVIPEFPSSLVLLTLMTLLTISAIMLKKRIYLQK